MITSFCPLCLSESEILPIQSQQQNIFMCRDHGIFILTTEKEKLLRHLHELSAYSAEHKAELGAISSREKLLAQQAHDQGDFRVREIQFDS